MIKDIIKEIMFEYVGRILPWLRKKIYPLKEFDKDIEIDVRRTNPINFSINSENPYLILYLTIKNKSQYLELSFDRGIINLSTENTYHQIIRDGAIIKKIEINKKGQNQIAYKFNLNEYQVRILKKLKDVKNLRMTFDITCYITSEIYKISKNIQLSGIHGVIE